MKQIVCPCGAQFKSHTIEEIVEIVNVHVKHAHPKDYPSGVPREQVVKMAQDA